ncbi:MAG: Gfo/Idh/MocA family oxidoreductase [Spirochaetaceae bacterium]|nr:Gfo/Idh/MocA family oxidoreductase [Spirochaetaceae bacterium]
MRTSDSTPLRVAVAGCHRQVTRKPGSHNWAAAFAEVADTRVVAVYDRGADTRAGFCAAWRDTWGEIAAYDDYRRMLGEARPDIVCIATRQTHHAAQIVDAAAARVRGILCDKPFATTLAEADEALAACRKAGVAVAYGTEWRWDPAYRLLAERLRRGLVGEVRAILAYGAPNLIFHGCHWYDIALLLAGDAEPLWVSGRVDPVADDEPDKGRRLDPPGRAWVGLDGGALLALLPEGGGRGFSVIGSAGRIEIVNDARQAYIWHAQAGGPGAGHLSAAPTGLELPQPDSPWPRGAVLVRDLARAVRTRGATQCDVEQIRRATEIGFAVHESHAAGGAAVTLPVADRTRRIDPRAWGND